MLDQAWIENMANTTKRQFWHPKGRLPWSWFLYFGNSPHFSSVCVFARKIHVHSIAEKCAQLRTAGEDFLAGFHYIFNRVQLRWQHFVRSVATRSTRYRKVKHAAVNIQHFGANRYCILAPKLRSAIVSAADDATIKEHWQPANHALSSGPVQKTEWRLTEFNYNTSFYCFSLPFFNI